MLSNGKRGEMEERTLYFIFLCAFFGTSQSSISFVWARTIAFCGLRSVIHCIEFNFYCFHTKLVIKIHFHGICIFFQQNCLLNVILQSNSKDRMYCMKWDNFLKLTNFPLIVRGDVKFHVYTLNLKSSECYKSTFFKQYCSIKGKLSQIRFYYW